jgi:hypothetical protein
MYLCGVHFPLPIWFGVERQLRYTLHGNFLNKINFGYKKFHIINNVVIYTCLFINQCILYTDILQNCFAVYSVCCTVSTVNPKLHNLLPLSLIEPWLQFSWSVKYIWYNHILNTSKTLILRKRQYVSIGESKSSKLSPLGWVIFWRLKSCSQFWIILFYSNSILEKRFYKKNTYIFSPKKSLKR